MDYLLLTTIILILLLIVLMAIPMSLKFHIHHMQTTQGVVYIHWFFGLVRFHTQLTNRLPAINAAVPTETGSSGYNRLRTINLLKQSGFRQRLIKLLRKMYHASHFENLYLKIHIGLDDPADTGMLWAIMGPVASLIKNTQPAEVNIEPDFYNEVLEIESHGSLKLIPLQIITLVTGFIISSVTLLCWYRINH